MVTKILVYVCFKYANVESEKRQNDLNFCFVSNVNSYNSAGSYIANVGFNDRLSVSTSRYYKEILLHVCLIYKIVVGVINMYIFPPTADT